MANEIYDPVEGYPQTVFEKIRRRILLRSGIFPGVLGRPNEANMRHLTNSKAATISETERSTGRKLDWAGQKEGD